MGDSSQVYYLCSFCAHQLKHVLSSSIACERCGHKNKVKISFSKKSTFSYSLAALIFFITANFLPFMTLDLYGNNTTTTIWGGIKSLMQSGAWFVAIVVLCASLIIPVLKILGLIFLSSTAAEKVSPMKRTQLYLFIESIGRWSMLDIFLVGILVAVVKLGSWAQVSVEPGAFLFLLVVIFTMLASQKFDSRLIWENYEKK